MTFGPVLCLVLWIINKFNLLRRYPLLKEKIDRCLRKVLWNGVLIFCYETYVVVCTVASIGIKDLRFGADTSSTERYCSVVSISLAAYVLLLPLLIAVLYL